MDSVIPMLGTCQKEVNYHWFSECDSWRPKGARHVWGRSVKCLGLIAGVSYAHLTLSLCSLFFRTPSQFRFLCVIFFRTPSHWKFLETPATQSLSRRFALGRLGKSDVTRRIVVKTLCNWKLKVSEECKLAKRRKMAAKFDNLQLTLLKQFVDLCKDKPQLLHAPQLKFFKDWLVR